MSNEAMLPKCKHGTVIRLFEIAKVCNSGPNPHINMHTSSYSAAYKRRINM